MKPLSILRNNYLLFFHCLIILSSLNCLYAQNSQKQLLSKAIEENIEQRGAEGAVSYFSRMSKEQRKQFEPDMEELTELTLSYVQNGDMETVTAVSEITSIFMQDMIEESVAQVSDKVGDLDDELPGQKQNQNNRQNERRTKPVEVHEQKNRLGEPRDDLEQFTGIYAVPGSDNDVRKLWVRVSCDGYLVSGAMWGDAAPWWMRSESESVFSYSDSFNSFRMEFMPEADTGMLEIQHTLSFMESPLQYSEPLPESMSACLDRSRM